MNTDTGSALRMDILEKAAEQQILKPLASYGWTAEIESRYASGEFLIISASKHGQAHRVALMYSSATDNRHYKFLDTKVEHIFTNGELYKIESFAFGLKCKVSPISDFFPLMVEWSRTISPPAAVSVNKRRPQGIIRITAEKPIDGIWTHLSQFASTSLAKKLIIRRGQESGIEIPEHLLDSKAAGVAFSIRNAADYFKSASHESLNKKVLSLYYGSLALAFAEMLSSPNGPSDLDEVEGMTKNGHGLYTVASNTNDFGGLTIGLLASGFFPRWVSFLGHDVSHFPRKKGTSSADLENYPTGSYATIEQLFSTLPELSTLYHEVYESEPSWVNTAFDSEAGFRLAKHKTGSSYIKLIDRSSKISSDRFSLNKWSISEIEFDRDEKSKSAIFRARVDHDGLEYWHQALPLHQSPFFEGSALILPVLGGVFEYRAISLSLLYALSILVRYMPSAWRRVEGGDWDQHLPMVKMTLDIFERVLPEQFLESITDQQIFSKMPGAF
ncbi:MULTISPECIES: YaaC family protein [Pseudomonas syringae group]|uniref:YaaC family protein n=1 Tax=Pseudomonas syringae group TaxID=136849 RepID=UPI000A22D2FF|nr:MULTISPECIES: hypothetical protein [Pseudomonas syringae group]MBL3635563.1 hypothetical protein [Pseudomonas syringae pv. actinidiae]MDU8584082.1 hypothetical protein [Pseudomonas syringae pv. actinidiae]OSR90166.1 hypothetical protein BV329_00315 [Pseudomonas syringae pv. actinidiae]